MYYCVRVCVRRLAIASITACKKAICRKSGRLLPAVSRSSQPAGQLFVFFRSYSSALFSSSAEAILAKKKTVVLHAWFYVKFRRGLRTEFPRIVYFLIRRRINKIFVSLIPLKNYGRQHLKWTKRTKKSLLRLPGSIYNICIDQK